MRTLMAIAHAVKRIKRNRVREPIDRRVSMETGAREVQGRGLSESLAQIEQKGKVEKKNDE